MMGVMSYKGEVELRLVDTEDQPVRDPGIAVQFQRYRDKWILLDSPRKPFDTSRVYPIPLENIVESVKYNVEPTLYKRKQYKSIPIRDGETTSRTHELKRRLSKWDVDFERWAELPDAVFGPLKRVLLASDRVDLHDDDGIRVGTLAGEEYDAIAGIEPGPHGEGRPKRALAKTSLLNLFAKMTALNDPTIDSAAGTHDWFGYVQKLLAIDQERMIAVVDSGLKNHVDQIIADPKRFEYYKKADSSRHRKNFPEQYTLVGDMVSIKSRDKKGNLQLTLTEARDRAGDSVHLLDADIDESGDRAGHTYDWIKHRFNDGTHPFKIYEYLRRYYPERALGYRLIPRRRR